MSGIRSKRIRGQGENTVIWHPYPETIPFEDGGQFLLTTNCGGFIRIETALKLGDCFSFIRSANRKILAWAYMPAAFGETPKASEGDDAKARKNQKITDTARVRRIVKNLNPERS